MNKIFGILFFFLSLFSLSTLSFAEGEKALSPAQERQAEMVSQRICDGIIPLYTMSMGSFYNNNSKEVVAAEVGKRIDSDKKENAYYTQIIPKDKLLDMIIDSTEFHTKSIMTKYPDNRDMYDVALKLSGTLILPMMCPKTVKDTIIKGILDE